MHLFNLSTPFATQSLPCCLREAFIYPSKILSFSPMVYVPQSISFLGWGFQETLAFYSSSLLSLIRKLPLCLSLYPYGSSPSSSAGSSDLPRFPAQGEHGNLFPFCFVFVFLFCFVFETEFLCITSLAVLKLALYTTLASNPQRSISASAPKCWD